MANVVFLRQFKLKLSCLILLFNLSASGQVDVLQRYLDTVSNGDVATWSKIRSLRATSVSFFSKNAFQNGHEDFNSDPLGYTILYKVWPGKEKEETYSDSLYHHLTGEFFFIENMRTILLRNVPPVYSKADKSRAFDFYPVKIHRYMEESRAIRNFGLTFLEGKQVECYDIEIETKKEKHRFLFNSKTFLLEAVYFPERKTYWYISEYRIFDGYLIPTYILGVKDGIVYEWTKYKSFDINFEIDPSKFETP
jgi:hypothetical protein